MKALPLWQPWASLVVIGAKRVETRSWSPPIALLDTRIAIYATVGTEPGGKRALAARCAMPYFRRALLEADAGADPFVTDPEELPRGAIVGTVHLKRATQMTAASIASLAERNPREHAFGDYAVDRWAWVLEDPLELAEPLETRPPEGARGWFDVELERPALFPP